MITIRDVPIAERLDEAIRNPVLMLGIIGTCFSIALLACVVSHLGSDDRGRPR